MMKKTINLLKRNMKNSIRKIPYVQVKNPS